jgi:glycosyltransferase involved in cell wall biosynthesis
MPDPLRVLHGTWTGEVGGAERALHLLVTEQMRDPEVQPAILFAQGGFYALEAQALGCPIRVLEARSTLDPRVLRRAVRFMRGYQVHHLHGAEPLLMAASLLCPGTRRVFTQRGGADDTYRFPLAKRLRYRVVRAMVRRFDAFSGNTAHAAVATEAFFGIPRDRVRTTYNGLQFHLLEPVRGAGEVRAELGIEPGDWVVGTAAVLKRWKRIDVLVRAAAEAGLPNLRLLIVGDGPERPALEALARELGIADRTVFAGIRTHIGDYLQVMDAFSLPSNVEESFGNAVVEAMAVGLPSVILEDSGGMREHIRDGETGLVVRDASGLAAALVRLHGDPSEAARLAAAGREHVRSTYTPPKAAERYKRLYREALGAAASTSATSPT